MYQTILYSNETQLFNLSGDTLDEGVGTQIIDNYPQRNIRIPGALGFPSRRRHTHSWQKFILLE